MTALSPLMAARGGLWTMQPSSSCSQFRILNSFFLEDWDVPICLPIGPGFVGAVSLLWPHAQMSRHGRDVSRNSPRNIGTDPLLLQLHPAMVHTWCRAGPASSVDLLSSLLACILWPVTCNHPYDEGPVETSYSAVPLDCIWP